MRAAGGDADMGMGDHGANTEGMREVHAPLAGAQGVCGE